MKTIIALLLLLTTVTAEETKFDKLVKKEKEIVAQLGASHFKERRKAKQNLSKEIKSIEELNSRLMALFLANDTEDPEIKIVTKELIDNLFEKYHMNGFIPQVSLAFGEIEYDYVKRYNLNIAIEEGQKRKVFMAGDVPHGLETRGLKNGQIIFKINGKFIDEILDIDPMSSHPMNVFLMMRGKLHKLHLTVFDPNSNKKELKTIEVPISHVGPRDHEGGGMKHDRLIAYKELFKVWKAKAKLYKDKNEYESL